MSESRVSKSNIMWELERELFVLYRLGIKLVIRWLRFRVSCKLSRVSCKLSKARQYPGARNPVGRRLGELGDANPERYKERGRIKNRSGI